MSSGFVLDGCRLHEVIFRLGEAVRGHPLSEPRQGVEWFATFPRGPKGK